MLRKEQLSCRLPQLFSRAIHQLGGAIAAHTRPNERQDTEKPFATSDNITSETRDGRRHRVGPGITDASRATGVPLCSHACGFSKADAAGLRVPALR
jgi:hypothetical protein